MKRHLQSLPTGHDNYEPVAYSQANPALNPADLQNTSDLATIWNGASTFSENIIEYAGRVCYRSTRRMGSAPRFIINRVKEGHEDIIEHLVATVRIGAAENPLGWRNWNRHCEITQEPSGSWLVSGNARVWLDLFRGGVGLAALPFLQSIAPKVYQEFADSTALPNPRISLPPACELPFSPHTLRPREEGSLRVTLLSFTQPTLDDVEAQLHHGSATFFFEGISRACTHQLVRHRLASFSQASQRYIQYEGHNPALPQASALPPFFAHIDTPLKAQVLGLLYADTITQQQPYISRPANDTAWLKRLGTLWGGSVIAAGRDPTVKLTIPATEVQALAHHRSVTPAQLSGELIRPFIRGYVEGKGQFNTGPSQPVLVIDGTPELLNWMCAEIPGPNELQILAPTAVRRSWPLQADLLEWLYDGFALPYAHPGMLKEAADRSPKILAHFQDQLAERARAMGVIFPPDFDPIAASIGMDAVETLAHSYAELRAIGVRKEDARFLLPNAAETRIVTTMNFAAWSHFLWLRAVDKAAQWEIRRLGQFVLEMLYTIAPAVFQDQWDVYQEKFNTRG